MEKKTLSMHQLSLMHLDFETSLREMVKGGYKACGIDNEKLEAYGVDNAVKLLQALPIEVTHTALTGFFTQKTEDEYQAAREKDFERIENAARIGTEVVLSVAGPLNGMSPEEGERNLIRGLRELADHAKPLGLKIGFEPIQYMYQDSYCFVNTLKYALEIVRACDRENLGLFIDTYHVWAEAGLMDTISEAGKLIVGCHINDWRPVTRSIVDRTIIGWGCIPLKEIFAALEKAGWDAWYDVEILSEELWNMPAQDLLAECRKQFEAIWA